ncbi:class F sortase [Kribbella sp.]|uniref:class F sortase n=1 Tax=Kribbella sp. TaxID=1871183 RepID=UPI002D22FCDC|nr:class F sortase [Kribbella sp.]HZX02686.1 class F sortase [Kribbella sp.]
MTRRIRGGRGGMIASAAIGGLATLVVLVMSLGPAGSGPMAIAPDEPAPTPTPTPTPAPTKAPATTQLGYSPATYLAVPSLGIRTSLVQLGTSKDKQDIQLPEVRKAGWFRLSAAPGQAGITVLVGYISHSKTEPGVFVRLAKLKPGAEFAVRRADGRTASYKVSALAYYPQGKLPAATVYKRTMPSELRLITCGGSLQPNQPAGNAVVTARLISTK